MLLPTGNLEKELFAKSAATIALHNFHWQYATLVLFNSSLISSVDLFLQSYHKNVIVGRGIFYPSFVTRTRQYVLFGADLADIVNMLTWMQRHQFDNSGNYIVICLSNRRESCNEAEAVNILWNFKIINVVLINEINKKENVPIGYTYYQPEDCNTAQPAKLKNWESCQLNDYLDYCRNMYPRKLNNLHGCPIVVSTFNQAPYMNISDGIPTGADGDLLCVIAKALNMGLVMMSPRIGVGWGKYEENGTWSGSLADVLHGWANFSMTSASVTLSRFTTFQLSTDYSVTTVAWVTHPSEIQPASLKLLRPFKPFVHIALVVSFLMVIVFKVLLTSKCLSSLKHKLNLSIPDGMLFHAWELCMGLPVNSIPTNKGLLCLAIVWIWYSFLIRTLYQVYLINSLKTDINSPEFDTIEEAIAAKYTFGGGLALRDYFIDNHLVYDNWENVESDEIYPILRKLSKGLKFVMAMNPETTKMFLSDNPEIKLHILPRLIITSPVVIFFKKYCPLASSLNVILRRLQESGIIQKIYLDNIGKKVVNESPDTNIPISMVHYTGCYAILLTGWLLSALCFVIEKLKLL